MDDILQERELVRSLRQGSEQAFENIYQLYSPRLFGRLLKLLKSEAEARQVLQEVFINLWEHRYTLDADKPFRSFIFKIAENKVYDYFQKAARDKTAEANLVALSTANRNGID